MTTRRTETFAFRVDADVMAEVREVARELGVTNAAAANVLLRAGLNVHGTVAETLVAAARARRGGDRS